MRKWEKDGLEFRVWPTNLNDETEGKTGEPERKVMEITRKLVRDIMLEMAKNSKKYVNSRYDLNDLPFTYNERSLDAIFLPVSIDVQHRMMVIEVVVVAHERHAVELLENERQHVDLGDAKKQTEHENFR